jgi:hypothetical protein
MRMLTEHKRNTAYLLLLVVRIKYKMDDWLSYFQAVVKIIYIAIYHWAGSESLAYIYFPGIPIASN